MDPLSVHSSSLDGDLSLLASRQRRLVLRYLVRESTTPASIDEIVAYIADNTAADRTASGKAVRIELYHRTLPKLEHHGLIEYDWRSGDVRYRSEDRIETLLECLPHG